MTVSMSIPEYYAGKTIFVTGATGLMGKVLVEKLLRSCPDIEKIHLLIRGSKTKDSNEKFLDLKNNQVFDIIRSTTPEKLEKLCLIPGDVTLKGLGITNENKKELQENCQIVFHVAASVSFDSSLRDAVTLNAGGTKRVLELAEGMTKLEVFEYVSTAFCHPDKPTTEEKLYPGNRHENVIDMLPWMDDHTLDAIQPKLIHPHPNTYSYAKALAEEIIAEYAGKFPIAVSRPSIVTCALKEPYPGWVDSLHGITSIIVGSTKGVVRTMYCNPDYPTELIPVDIAVNGCIILAYFTALEKPKGIEVTNLTMSNVNSSTWGKIVEAGGEGYPNFPYSKTFWYPGGTMKKYRIHDRITFFYAQIIPALFVDLLLFLLGHRTFMLKLQRRISKGFVTLEYYGTRLFYFKNDKFLAYQKRLLPKDNETFFTDLKAIDWKLYMYNYTYGGRVYCCKESPETIPQGKRLYRLLTIGHIILMTILYGSLAYFLYTYVISRFLLL